MPDSVTYNLVILFTPKLQDMEHWVAVKLRIDARARDIEARIVNRHSPGRDNLRWIQTRPSMIFSPFSPHDFHPPRGKIFGGTRMSKSLEIERMVAAGIPVPRTMQLVRNFDFEAASLGPFVIVKPVRGYLGERVTLVAVSDLERRFDQLTDKGLREMLVQEFIDVELDDERPLEYRVYSVFGRPFSAMRRRWRNARPPVDRIASDPKAIIATSTPGVAETWEVCRNEEIVELANSVAPVFDEIPCLGIDIVRSRDSGKLFVLEVDSIGTDIALIPHRNATPEERAPFFNQFGGLEAIADSLIERTRAFAA